MRPVLGEDDPACGWVAVVLELGLAQELLGLKWENTLVSFTAMSGIVEEKWRRLCGKRERKYTVLYLESQPEKNLLGVVACGLGDDQPEAPLSLCPAKKKLFDDRIPGSQLKKIDAQWENPKLMDLPI